MIDQSKLARQEEALLKWRNKGGINKMQKELKKKGLYKPVVK